MSRLKVAAAQVLGILAAAAVLVAGVAVVGDLHRDINQRITTAAAASIVKMAPLHH